MYFLLYHAVLLWILLHLAVLWVTLHKYICVIHSNTFSKCPFTRTHLIQCQRQPGRDRELVPAVHLQPVAFSDARDWRVGEKSFSRRPIHCRLWAPKEVGAIPALCCWQPAQLLLSWCERKLICVWFMLLSPCELVFILIISLRPQSQSTPPECLVHCFSLLTGVLAGYVSTGFLTEDEACHSQLFTKAKVSFRCVTVH